MANKKKIITPAMVKRAEALAKKGLNNSQIAVSLGLGKTKIYKELETNTELQEAISVGKMSAVEEVTNALFETALKGNVSAQIFFLKNRAEWRDKNETEISGGFKHETIEVTFK